MNLCHRYLLFLFLFSDIQDDEEKMSLKDIDFLGLLGMSLFIVLCLTPLLKTLYEKLRTVLAVC